jgi:hypothetical protein
MGAVAKRFMILQGYSALAKATTPSSSSTFPGRMPKMPTQLPPREPTEAQLLVRCGRYIAGIAILLVALALFELRLVRASHATARLGERIGGGPPVFS